MADNQRHYLPCKIKYTIILLFKLVSQEFYSNVSDSACATFYRCICQIRRHHFDWHKKCTQSVLTSHITYCPNDFLLTFFSEIYSNTVWGMNSIVLCAPPVLRTSSSCPIINIRFFISFPSTFLSSLFFR